MRNIRLILLFILPGILLYSQTPTLGDCLGARPVCESIYEESESPVGPGTNNNEIHPDNCVQNETNSVWYTFTVQETGNFGFLLTPNNIDDDYDWSLFNITGKSCGDILTDPDLVASCNAAGGQFAGFECNGITGANGDYPYDIQGFGCGNMPPGLNGGFSPINDLISVQKGETYALCIINWTGSEFGYTLDFDVDDVNVFDIINPSVNELNTKFNDDDCSLEEIEIVFSEYIKCSELTDDKFSITGPSANISYSLVSDECISGGNFTNKIIIEFDTPLVASGNYEIRIETISDLCDNFMETYNEIFTIEAVDVIETTVLDTLICEGDIIPISGFISDDYAYQWSDGDNNSARNVSEAGTYSLNITGNCENFVNNYIINNYPAPSVDVAEINPDICDSANGSIRLNNNPSKTYAFDSLDFSDTNTFQNLSSGDYSIRVIDDNGCFAEEIITVPAVESSLDVSFSEDIYTVDYNDEVQILAEIKGEYVSAAWIGDNISDLSCNFCLDPTLTGFLTDSYTFEVSDTVGCIIQKEILVRVIIPRDFYAPNTFTPNNDGINENFTLFTNEVITEIVTLKVYNRWGELVFENNNFPPNDTSQGWNGLFKNRSVNNSSYTWYAELKYIDDEILQFSGIVSIMK